MAETRVVLITGASSGIGKATADMLINKGFRVYGTSRRCSYEEVVEVNGTAGGFLRMIPLELRSEESVIRAVEYVISQEGRIDILVNNAGYGLAGSVEETSDEEAQQQFDTNFFGMLRVYRNVVPLMRAQRSGRIVTVSSVAAQFPIPFQSMYSASKYAVEAATEALRMEVAPLGIQVTLVEPGDINTGFTAARQTVSAAAKGSVYGVRFSRAINAMIKSEISGPEPKIVAKVIDNVIHRDNPPVRVVVGLSYKSLALLKRFLPDRLIHFILAKMY